MVRTFPSGTSPVFLDLCLPDTVAGAVVMASGAASGCPNPFFRGALADPLLIPLLELTLLLLLLLLVFVLVVVVVLVVPPRSPILTTGAAGVTGV